MNFTSHLSPVFQKRIGDFGIFFLLPSLLLSKIFSLEYLYYSIPFVIFLGTIYLLSRYLEGAYRYFPLLLFILFCTINYDLIQGIKVVSHDTFTIQVNFTYFMQSLSKGNFPYWSNYYNMGEPFFMYNNLLLYPFWFPFLLIGALFNGNSIVLFNLTFIAEVIFFLVSCYLFLSHILERKESIFLCLTIILFSPITADFHREFSPFHHLLLFFPLFLHCAFTFLKDNTKKWHFILLCFLIGLIGNIYVPHYSLFPIIVSLLCFWFVIPYKWNFLTDKKFIPPFLIGAIIIVLLSAPVLYTFVYFKDSCYAPTRWEGSVPSNLAETEKFQVDYETLTFAAPATHGDFFHLIFKNTETFFMGSSEIGTYCGIITLLLAFYAGVFSRNRHKLPILLLIAFFASYSLGKGQILFLLINKLLPSFDYIRNTEFYITYFVFFIIILAGLGFDLIFRKKKVEIRSFVYPISIIGFIFLLYSSTIDPLIFGQSLWNFLLLSLAFLALLIGKIPKKILFSSLFFLILLDMGDYYLHRKELLTKDTDIDYQIMDENKISWNTTNVLYASSPNEVAPYHGAFLKRKNVMMKADYQPWDFMILKEYYHFLQQSDIYSYYPYLPNNFLNEGATATELLKALYDIKISDEMSLPELFPEFLWKADKDILLENINLIINDYKKRNILLEALAEREWKNPELNEIVRRARKSTSDLKNRTTLTSRLVFDELYALKPLKRIRDTVFGLYYDRLKFVTNNYYLQDQSRVYSALKEINKKVSLPNRSNFIRNFAIVNDPAAPPLTESIDTFENLMNSHQTSLVYNVLDYSSDRAIFKITVKQKGFLVYNDTFEKGWVAKINGKGAEVLRVNGIAKGLKINEPGTYIVEFLYDNKAYKYSLYSYLITLGLFLVIFPLSYYRKRTTLSSS